LKVLAWTFFLLFLKAWYNFLKFDFLEIIWLVWSHPTLNCVKYFPIFEFGTVHLSLGDFNISVQTNCTSGPGSHLTGGQALCDMKWIISRVFDTCRAGKTQFYHNAHYQQICKKLTQKVYIDFSTSNSVRLFLHEDIVNWCSHKHGNFSFNVAPENKGNNKMSFILQSLINLVCK
jgi:hypothetical protein